MITEQKMKANLEHNEHLFWDVFIPFLIKVGGRHDVAKHEFIRMPRNKVDPRNTKPARVNDDTGR